MQCRVQLLLACALRLQAASSPWSMSPPKTCPSPRRSTSKRQPATCQNRARSGRWSSSTSCRWNSRSVRRSGGQRYMPVKKLRKVTAHFYSQELAGKKWGHPCVIFLPADNAANLDAAAQRQGGHHRLAAARLLSHPRRQVRRADRRADRLSHDGACRIPASTRTARTSNATSASSTRLRKQTGKNYYNMNCQLAVVYIQAMNAFQQFLGLDSLQAVVGGHSKRGRSATVAAAIDPRVASVDHHGQRGRLRHRPDPVAPVLPPRLLPGPGQRARVLPRRDQRRRLQDVQRQHPAGAAAAADDHRDDPQLLPLEFQRDPVHGFPDVGRARVRRPADHADQRRERTNAERTGRCSGPGSRAQAKVQIVKNVVCLQRRSCLARPDVVSPADATRSAITTKPSCTARSPTRSWSRSATSPGASRATFPACRRS